MTEKLKKLISLLCLIAMLSVVSTPAIAGGEHPFDSDGNPTEGADTDADPTDDPPGETVTGAVYIGSGGIISFVGQSFYSFLVRITGQDLTKSGKQVDRSSESGTQG